MTFLYFLPQKSIKKFQEQYFKNTKIFVISHQQYTDNLKHLILKKKNKNVKIIVYSEICTSDYSLDYLLNEKIKVNKLIQNKHRF